VKRLVRYGIILASCWATASIYRLAVGWVRGRYGRDVQNWRRYPRFDHRAQVPIFAGGGETVDRRPGDRDRRRSCTNGRLPLARAVGFYLLASFRWGWVTHTWDDIVHDAKTIGSDIKAFVTKAINLAVSAIEYGMRDAVGAVESTIGTLTPIILDAYNYGKQALSELEHVGGVVVGDVLGEAESFAKGLFDTVEHEVSTVEGLAHDVGDAVGAEFDTLERWVTTDVAGPIWGWIDKAFSTVERWVEQWWVKIYHDVILPIARDAKTAATDVEHAGEWIEHEGLRTAELVAKAADWLVWFGVHSIEDLAGGAGGLQSDFVSFVRLAAGQAAADDVDVIANAISKALG
jgi:hypothetical protein